MSDKTFRHRHTIGNRNPTGFSTFFPFFFFFLSFFLSFSLFSPNWLKFFQSVGCTQLNIQLRLRECEIRSKLKEKCCLFWDPTLCSAGHIRNTRKLEWAHEPYTLIHFKIRTHHIVLFSAEISMVFGQLTRTPEVHTAQLQTIHCLEKERQLLIKVNNNDRDNNEGQ